MIVMSVSNRAVNFQEQKIVIKGRKTSSSCDSVELRHPVQDLFLSLRHPEEGCVKIRLAVVGSWIDLRWYFVFLQFNVKSTEKL